MANHIWESIRDFLVQSPLYWFVDHLPSVGVTIVALIGWARATALRQAFLGATLAGLSILLINVVIDWAPYLGLFGGGRPLADDSVKWQIANDLYDRFHSVNSNCHVLMFQTDSDYAVKTSNDLQKILRLAGCSVSEPQPDYTQTKGLTICTWRTSYGSEFGSFLKTKLADSAHLNANHNFYGDMPPPKCPAMPCKEGQDCMAVTVGNQPEP